MNRYRKPSTNLSLLLEHTLNWDLFIYLLLEMRKLTYHFHMQLFLGMNIPSKGPDWFRNSGLVFHNRQAGHSKWGSTLWRQDAVNHWQPMTFDPMSCKAMCHLWEAVTSSTIHAHGWTKWANDFTHKQTVTCSWTTWLLPQSWMALTWTGGDSSVPLCVCVCPRSQVLGRQHRVSHPDFARH